MEKSLIDLKIEKRMLLNTENIVNGFDDKFLMVVRKTIIPVN